MSSGSEIAATTPVQAPAAPPSPAGPKRRRYGWAVVGVALLGLLAGSAFYLGHSAGEDPKKPSAAPSPAAPIAKPWSADDGAVLPSRRIVAFYAVPGADITGPAATISNSMLDRLKAQGAAYEALDPAHPVALGIDLVVSIPDGFPGDNGTYSHRVDTETIQRYVDFCAKNNLLLFLDLNFGWSNPTKELDYFRPWLQLPFVHVAVDPEWMFPRRTGIPGYNLSNVLASDLNPLITAVGDMAKQYQVPRKIFLLHQYRGDGDGLANPTDPAVAEFADKRNIVNDPDVDVVVHVDSVGGWEGDIALKTQQYGQWVREDMNKYKNFRYGGFKIFYRLEARNRLMTPAEVLKLNPAPMLITYGN